MVIKQKMKAICNSKSSFLKFFEIGWGVCKYGVFEVSWCKKNATFLHFPQDFVLKVWFFWINKYVPFSIIDYYDEHIFAVICIIREIIKYLSKISVRFHEFLQNVT